MSTYDPPCFGLGVKTVAWSPTGQFLAIGSYDEKVKLQPYLEMEEGREGRWLVGRKVGKRGGREKDKGVVRSQV